MVLDDTQRQRVQEWLIAHSPNQRIPDCPFCTNNAGQWDYSIYTPILQDWAERPLPYKPRRATVELICRVCGYQLGFDARPMGVVDSEAVVPESLLSPLE